MDEFVLNPAETKSDFLAGLRDLLDQDGELARGLAEILTADIEHEDDALQAMVRVAQNIRTVKGSVVGVIVGADTIDRSAHSPCGSIADVHQTVAAVQPGGIVVEATVGDVVAGDKIVTGDIRNSVVATGAGAHVVYQNIERALTQVQLLEQERIFARRQLAEAVTRYVDDLVQTVRSAEDAVGEGNPYKALLAYDIDDAALFFGRARAKVAMLEHVRQGQLTVLHADSGAGQTKPAQSRLDAGTARMRPCALVDSYVGRAGARGDPLPAATRGRGCPLAVQAFSARLIVPGKRPVGRPETLHSRRSVRGFFP